jgi:hypothetical protein
VNAVVRVVLAYPGRLTFVMDFQNAEDGVAGDRVIAVVARIDLVNPTARERRCFGPKLFREVDRRRPLSVRSGG